MERLGKYRITSLIGRGGFGRVYRAYDPTVGREVAIKVISSDAGDEQQDLLARFKLEATAAGVLRHKNIITVYEYGEHEGTPYLVMEYLDGQDLHDVLHKRGSLNLLDKLSIMSQVAEGLHHAHLHGVVHRDVKPANIMVLSDGSVKIMDFGIARLTREQGTRLTQTGTLMGTVPYMAPEQFAGGAVDHITDIFAYGVILYEVLTERHPFHPPGATAPQVMFNIGTLTPPPISSLVPGCPAALDQVVARTLEKHRDQRYQTLEDVLIDLAPIRIEVQAAFGHSLLQEADRLLNEGKTDEARAIVRDVLLRDPSNTTARQLRETIQRQFRQQTRDRSHSLAAAGRQYLEAGSYAEAIRVLEEARRVDTDNITVSALLEQAREAARQAERAAELLSRARLEYESGNLSGACQIVLESLELTPGNEEASSLLATIRQEMDQRERQRRLQETVARVNELVAACSFDEALEALGELEASYPSSRTLKQLQSEIREKREAHRRELLAQATARARQAASEGRYEEAEQALDRLSREYPQANEIRALREHVTELVKARDRAIRIQQALDRSQALAEADDFEKARRLVEAAIEQDPGEAKLVAMRERLATEHRSYELGRVARQAEGLAAANQFQDALETLDQAMLRWGGEHLAELRTRIDQDRQRHQRGIEVEAAAVEARRLIAREDFAAAAGRLRETLARYPDQPELGSLLESAKTQLEEHARAQQITAVAGRVDELLGAQAFDQATNELEDGFRRFPDSQELRERKRRLEEALENATCAQVESLVERKRFAEAIHAADTALKRFPANTQLQQMRRAAETGHRDQERARSIEAAVNRARAAKDNGGIDQAIATLEQEVRKSGRDPELDSLLATLRHENARLQREAAFARIVEEAEALARKKDFAAATAVIERGLLEFPADPELGRRLAEVQRLKKQAGIETLRAEIEALRAAGDLEKAATMAKSAAQASPDVTSLRELAESISTELRRRDQAWEAAREARSLLDRGEPEAAEDFLKGALKRFPGEPDLVALLGFASATVEALRRVAFIDETARKVHLLLAQSRPEQAIALLDEGSRRYPDCDELRLLRESATEKATVLRRQAEIQRTIGEAQSCVENALGAGNPRLALSAVAAALAKFPGEPVLVELQRRAEQFQREQEEVQVRAHDLQLVRKLTRKVKSTRSLANLETVAREIRSIGEHHRGHAEFDSAWNAAEEEIRSRSAELTLRASSAPALTPAAGIEHLLRPKFLIPGAAAAVLLTFGIWRIVRPTAPTGVVVTTNPAGAELKIGNQTCAKAECQFELPEGAYTVEAMLEGYRIVKRTVAIPSPSGRVRIDLEPLPARLMVSSNLESGSVLLDGQAAGELIQGKFMRQPIPPGKHELEVRGSSGESARVEFEVKPGQAPALTRPVISSQLQALAVGQLGRKAGMISDGKRKTASAANRSLGVIGDSMMVVNDLAAETVEIALEEGSRVWTYALQPSAEPSLVLFLSANLDAGTLLVETGVPGADVLVNGRRQGQTGEGGALQVALRTGNYRVTVTKNGYDSPAPAALTIDRDGVRRARLPLKPRGAALAFSGALPGTEVLIDGQAKGTFSDRGNLSLSPGQHSIELRKPGYRTARLQRQFDPGSTVVLGPQETALVQLPKSEPDPGAIERERWEVAQNSRDIAVLEQFRKNYPSSPRAKLAADRIEMLEWDAVRSRNEAGALQAFLGNYPNSSHRGEAEEIIARIVWQNTDRNSVDALRAYAQQHPRNAQQALREIERLEQEGRRAADVLGVQQALRTYAAAINRKDLPSMRSLWPSMPGDLVKKYQDSFKIAKSISTEFQSTSQPLINGNAASITCRQAVVTVFPERSQPNSSSRLVTVSLQRNPSGWVIRSIEQSQ